MPPASLAPLLQHLRKITDLPRSEGVGDGELLERFVRLRDEAAFELLVWRHQRMVLGVCRRVLHDTHDAEDAFQAAFLTLARRAEAVRRCQSVAGWLHKVAYHLALRVRKRAARRATVDLEDAIECRHDPAEAAHWREVAAVLDEEVSRLPERYRLPVVLCYLEGRTYQEAGRQLGLPVGTLSARLTRARALLRRRLARRGVGISGGVFAMLLCEQASSAAAPAELVKAATAISAGQAAVSGTLAALTDGVLGASFVGKVKIVAAVLLAGLFVAGASVLAFGDPQVHPDAPAQAPQSSGAAGVSEKADRVDRQGDPLPAGALFRFGSVRLRHDGGIRAAALSPDGKLLATSSGHSVIVWDLQTDRPLRRLVTDHPWHFCTPGLVFSPDGKYLGYVQCSDFACIWETRSGEQLAQFVGSQRHPYALCQFTPDGKAFIFKDDNRVVFWDVQTKAEARSLPIEQGSLLSPDTRFCLHIEEKRAIHIHDARTGEETSRLNVAAVHNGLENGIRFAPDGKSLAIVHQNREIQVREWPSGRFRVTFSLPESAHFRVNSQDPKDRDRWEYGVFFSHDGKELLLGTKAGLIHRWSLVTRQELPSLSRHVGAVAGVHTLPDGKTILTTGADGLIRRWDRQSGRELTQPPGYAGHTHAAYSPDGRFAAVGDTRGRLDLWDARTGRLLRTLRRDGPAVRQLVFTPDGRTLAQARADNAVEFWRIPGGVAWFIHRFDTDQGLFETRSLTFSRDGRRLFLGGCQRPRLCEWASGKELWRDNFYFEAATFSRDGSTLLVASGPFLLFLDAVSNERRGMVQLQTGTPDNVGVVEAMALSPDGRRLALGLHTGEVYLCDAQSGADATRFRAVDPPPGTVDPIQNFAHSIIGQGVVWSLSFSPDGRWLGTSGTDGRVRLWEVATRQEVLRLTAHQGYVHEVAFGADSRTILSCGEDAQAYLWSLRPPSDPEAKLSLDSLWAALAGEPAKAYRAIWRLSEAEGAAAFLRGKLARVQPATAERVKQWIADLDSDSFAVRESATKSLAELGEIVAPAMRKALSDKPSLEMRKRLEDLIERVETRTVSVEVLRIGRAIDVLERIGTSEARQVLHTLASGVPEAMPTMAAQAALERLTR
jgi:RNA polymerase sigma factor (sigma-70 family)